MDMTHRFTLPAALPLRSSSYAEAAYFDGEHCQHIADWEESKRLARKRTEAIKALDRRGYRRAA